MGASVTQMSEWWRISDTQPGPGKGEGCRAPLNSLLILKNVQISWERFRCVCEGWKRRWRHLGGRSGEAPHSLHMKYHDLNLLSRNSNNLELNSDLNWNMFSILKLGKGTSYVIVFVRSSRIKKCGSLDQALDEKCFEFWDPSPVPFLSLFCL